MRVRDPDAKITELVVKALAPHHRVYDPDVKGFFVEAGLRFKRYGVIGDAPGGKTLGHAIGRAPPHGDWSASKARSRAVLDLALIKQGIDPRTIKDRSVTATVAHVEAEEAKAIPGLTLHKAWSRFADSVADKVAGDLLSKKTQAFYEQAYARLAPCGTRDSWADLPLVDIVTGKAADGEFLVASKHKALTKDCGRRAANASLALFRQIYELEAGKDLSLPVWRPKMYQPNKGAKNTASKALVFDPKAWNVRRLDLHSKLKQALALLTIATGCRKADLIGDRYGKPGLRWADIDFATRSMTLTSPKGHHGHESRAYSIYLNDLALEALTVAQGVRTKSDQVFPNRSNPDKCCSWPWIEKSMGPHVLRGYLANVAQKPELDLSAAEQLAVMNHRTPGAHGHYVNAADTRRAFERVGAVIARELVEGRTRQLLAA